MEGYQLKQNPEEEEKQGHLLKQIEQDQRVIDEFMHNNHINKKKATLFKKALNTDVQDEKAFLNIEQQSNDDHIDSQSNDEEQSQSSEQSEQSSMADEELYQYIKDMIDMINTDDEKLNKENKEILVDQISTRLKQQKIPHEKKQIEQFLEEMKVEINAPETTPGEKKQKLRKVTESFYKVGYVGYYTATKGEQAAASVSLGISAGATTTLSTNLLSSSTWILGAFVYTAQTGLNYRRFKKGNIDKKEFWRRTKLGSFTTVGSIAGGAGGLAAGFAIGTAILPGVGTIIGSVVGGIGGGFLGEKLTAKAYGQMEKQMQKSKELKEKKDKEKSEQFELEKQSSENYSNCLTILGIEEDKQNELSLEQIENAYLKKLEEINDNKAQNIEQDEDQTIEYQKQYNQVIEAFEDAKDFLQHTSQQCIERT